MIQALRSLGHNQFERAKWYPTEDKNDYKLIGVAVVSENEKRWDTVISNIITASDNTVLLTNYAYPYKTRQHIFYRDKWWEIIAVGEKTLDINPQAMSLLKPKYNTQYVLEIKERDKL